MDSKLTSIAFTLGVIVAMTVVSCNNTTQMQKQCDNPCDHPLYGNSKCR